MEELQERRRRRAIRVAITEILMVISVIFLVVVLTFIVMGYTVDRDLNFERTGLVQIDSTPTGATVTIDGQTLFLRTNFSRTMTSGQYELTLSKDGYISWNKTITVREGIFYRLLYPRLILSERTPTSVLSFSENLDSISIAPNRTTMLARDNGIWGVVSLNDSEPTFTSLAISTLPASVCLENLSIKSWSRNSGKVLALATCHDTIEWELLDIKDLSLSVNLSHEFSLNFTDVVIANDSAERLLVLENNHLREINISALEISKVLLTNITSFTTNGKVVAYVTPGKDGKKQVGIYQDGEKGGTIIASISSDSEVHAIANEYYEDEYLIITTGNQISVYSGTFPSFEQSTKPTMKNILDETLDFTTTSLKTRGGGELIEAKNGNQVAILDMESFLVSNYTTDGNIYWLDDFMYVSIKDGNLVAYDFDSTNERPLSGGVKDSFPAVISGNNKWLYYINTDNKLTREKIN